MPFMTVRLAQPGVKTIQTPTLLTANIVESDLIRWRGGLPEKVGGWKQYYNFPLSGGGIIRELWAWADLNNQTHLAAGGDNGVTVITNNIQQDVTPLFSVSTPAISFTTNTTAGTANQVVIHDVGSNMTTYQSITLQTPVSVGGIVILPGNYPIISVASPDQYTILIPNNATAVATNAGQTALFTCAANSANISVNLPNHGLSVGSNFSIVLPTTVPQAGGTGSVTLQGFYVVQSVTDANDFVIAAPNQTTVAGTAYYGNLLGNASILHWEIVTQQPAGGGWGIGPYGGFVTGAATHRQSAGAATGTSCSFSAPVSNGGTVIAAVLGTTAGGVPTLNDDQNNHYPAIASSAAGGGNTVWAFYLSDIVNGPITLSTTGGVISHIAADEFADISGNLDGSSALYTASSTTTASSGSLTTTSNGDLIWGVVAVNTGTWTPGSGFTAGFNSTNWGTEYQFQTTAGAIAATAGVSASSQTWLVALALKPLTGGTTAWGQSPAPPPITGTKLLSTDWCIENWGSEIIINPQGYPLFHWNPTTGLGQAQVIVAGPSIATGFFLAMPEQQIVAYGASVAGVQDPMLVAWCDNANYNTWSALTSNQAGTYRLTRGSKIVGGIQGPQQAMLWTDVGLWLMQYIGYPDVYGFNEIARGCGLIAKKAVAVVGAMVIWMSRDAFFAYSNGAVQQLPCDVWDVVIKNLNISHLDHIRAGANTGFNEFVLSFPSQASTGENDMYVKMNTMTGEWDYGYWDVTEWTDVSVLGHPLSAMLDSSGANSVIMQHEMSDDANGVALPYSFRSSFFQLSEAEDFVFIDYCMPDFRWKRWPKIYTAPPGQSAQVNMTFYVSDNPDEDIDNAIAIGPFQVNDDTGAIDIRCRGRYFSFAVAGNDLGSFMRLGGVKFRFAPDGRAGF